MLTSQPLVYSHLPGYSTNYVNFLDCFTLFDPSSGLGVEDRVHMGNEVVHLLILYQDCAAKVVHDLTISHLLSFGLPPVLCIRIMFSLKHSQISSL